MMEKDNILQSLKDNDVNVGVIAKYGFQLAPVAESRDYVADQFVTVKKASFGATTSTVYEPLDEEYIATRVSEGKGKYISPDKKVDASTCFFPDSTWFTKGISHSNWTNFETVLLYKVVTADRQLTIDDFNFSQFVVYDKETDWVQSMTEDNYKTEPWTANKGYDKAETKEEKLFTSIVAIIRWFVKLIRFLVNRFAATQA